MKYRHESSYHEKKRRFAATALNQHLHAPHSSWCSKHLPALGANAGSPHFVHAPPQSIRHCLHIVLSVNFFSVPHFGHSPVSSEQPSHMAHSSSHSPSHFSQMATTAMSVLRIKGASKLGVKHSYCRPDPLQTPPIHCSQCMFRTKCPCISRSVSGTCRNVSPGNWNTIRQRPAVCRARKKSNRYRISRTTNLGLLQCCIGGKFQRHIQGTYRLPACHGT